MSKSTVKQANHEGECEFAPKIPEKNTFPDEINGWDARDYKLWSDFGVLQSYGRINRTDHLVSLNEVEALLRKHAEQRFSEKHRIDLGPDHGGYRGDQTPDEDA